MANITGVVGNIPKIRHSYRKTASYGETAVSDEWILTIEEYPDLRYLLQNFQIPPVIREAVETYGPQGTKFVQQGRYNNSQDIPITFKEVITGLAYKAIREWVKEKKYLTVKLALAGESYPTSVESNSWLLEDCWIELEGVDLSYEDGASIVRPSGTLHANWISHLDNDQNVSLSLEG